MTDLPRRIAAVGAGRMGRGIALAFAYAGYDIAVVDLKARDLQSWERLRADASAEMGASLEMLADLEAMPREAIPRVMGRIRLVSERDAAATLAQAEVVFEGVPETLAAKQDAFGRLCAMVPGDAILASTTSTVLPGDLAAFATRPERVLNAHWLNPAFVIPLVELSAHAGTARAPIERLRRLLEDIGKVPVLCAAAPGYIVPRLQALVMNEAARMVEEGVASAEDIDRATRYGLGLRFAALGVIEFIDYGGNDILYYASRYLAERLSRERYQTPQIVERLMREGRNGLRSGEGFYDYRGRDLQAYRRDALARTLGQLRHAGLYRPPK
jgi:3-hydroxybutyryl-CoA dehydrogenase